MSFDFLFIWEGEKALKTRKKIHIIHISFKKLSLKLNTYLLNWQRPSWFVQIWNLTMVSPKRLMTFWLFITLRMFVLTFVTGWTILSVLSPIFFENPSDFLPRTDFSSATLPLAFCSKKPLGGTGQSLIEAEVVFLAFHSRSIPWPTSPRTEVQKPFPTPPCHQNTLSFYPDPTKIFPYSGSQ